MMTNETPAARAERMAKLWPLFRDAARKNWDTFARDFMQEHGGQIEPEWALRFAMDFAGKIIARAPADVRIPALTSCVEMLGDAAGYGTQLTPLDEGDGITPPKLDS